MVTDKDREAYLSLNTLPESDAADVRAGKWDNTTGIRAFAAHRESAIAEHDAQLVKWFMTQAWKRDGLDPETCNRIADAIEAGEPWK